MFEFLARHHITDKIMAVGVSGGADSLALALMANEELRVYGIKIVALTVNHQLRKSADAEAEYVAEVMQKYGIEHHILQWQGKKPKTGKEEAARQARYKLLKNWCEEQQIGCLMMAHHLQDQAETFLLRLQRGSGLEGLCAMREVSTWCGLKILRPLLYENPQKMRDYLLERKLQWVQDESNKDTQFLRNKMRAFLPVLEKELRISPAVLAATAKRLQSAEAYIDSQVAIIMTQDVRQYVSEVARIKYQDYLQWHQEIKFRILGKLLKQEYIPRADSLLQLIKALNKLPFNGTTLGNKEIFMQSGWIWIVPELHSKHKSSEKQWKEFVLQHRQFAQDKIPHKARLAILKQVEIKNDL